MKAVMFGAGNIGRGFLGLLMFQAGYEVTFIDVNQHVVSTINEKKRYPVRIVRSSGHEDIWCENVSAINGNDEEQTTKAIEQADLIATAVGVNALKFIAPTLAKGFAQRSKTNPTPINIIICENLIDADIYLHKIVTQQQLTQPQKQYIDDCVGFIEASIGRMVPIVTDEQKKENELIVCVEPYCALPVNKTAIKGDVPKLPGIFAVDRFEFYIERKLFLHNMGHATCAYLAQIMGYETIHEAMLGSADIYRCTQNAMLESARALCKKFDQNLTQLQYHISDLLFRFENTALNDTAVRVGNDIVRKTSPNDRLFGALRCAKQNGEAGAFICIGIAAAFVVFEKQEQNAQEKIDQIFEAANFSKQDNETILIKQIMQLLRKKEISAAFCVAQKAGRLFLGEII